MFEHYSLVLLIDHLSHVNLLPQVNLINKNHDNDTVNSFFIYCLCIHLIDCTVYSADMKCQISRLISYNLKLFNLATV